MKRANKQIQGRAVSRHADKQRKTMARRRLMLEGLEQRQLLAATPLADLLPKQVVQSILSGGEYVSQEARDATYARYADGAVSPSGNLGGPTAENPPILSPTPLTVVESESNDSVLTAQRVRLGNQPGQYSAIDLSGSLTLGSAGLPIDADWFRFTLKAGDVFNVQSTGAVTDLSLVKVAPSGAAGIEIAGTDRPLGLLPEESPLLREGVASMAVVVPEDGDYALRAGVSLALPNQGSIYTLNLRTFRPGIEYRPVGTSQTLFLDFDGGIADLSDLLDGAVGFGSLRIDPFSQAMLALGLEDSDSDRLIDAIVAEVEENFRDLGFKGNNGNFSLTGTPGDFHLNVLNSRDHADPWGLPGVSRIMIGGPDIIFGGAVFGVASSVDIGNYDLEDTAFVFPEVYAGLEETIEGIAASRSLIDFYGKAMGLTVSHEAAHFFGAEHTVNTNRIANIVDTGGNIPGRVGVGPDEIFGSEDDTDTDFAADLRDEAAAPVPYGIFDTVNALAFNLGTGTVGGTVSGTVYQDLNRNRTQNSGEPGLAGVTVYADINGNGAFDAGEFADVTNASGNYSFAVSPGSVRIGVVSPPSFAPTTAASQTVSVALDGSADVDFGMTRISADVTGFKWNDLDGDGIRDTGEPGIPGVYVYLDLDGDDRIDLGEPRGITKADGSYSIVFPGPGTYTLREVVEPGMLQTFPQGGEHQVVFNGTALTDNYNFGNQSVQDFGDAPAPYPTLAANNGAVHGVTAGFGLGVLTDAESDGQPTANATGDDANGVNDEDGIVQRSPLSPGSTTNVIDVSVRNAEGATGYLQGWIDLNQDGDWSDAGEHILVDRAFVGTTTETLQFALPASAKLGETFVRFRLSATPGVGPTGFTSAGEVEDYQVTLVATPELANDDSFVIPRGAVSVPLNVLANDFDPAFNRLTISSVNTAGTRGAVVIANDGRSVFYTPRSDTLGEDSFTYTVTNETGTVTGTATVSLNVVFQSAEPIAVDDSYNLPSGASNQTLNVLANDVPSIAGGNQIIAVSSPDENGQVSISTDRQRLIYSPASNFAGTEQFTYTISDRNGEVSTASVTVHLQPGSQADDQAAFLVQTLALDGVTQIQTIQAGQQFKVRVLVDDIRAGVAALQQGVDAAYLDLLYTDGLVATVPSSNPSSPFPFEISFGAPFESLRNGDAETPGVFNEIGATQSPPLETFDEPMELFTLTLRAISPGIAEFITDPADALVSDTVVRGSDEELTPSQIRFGRSQLTIVPTGSDFTFAVDDSYPDGRDSAGNLITSAANARLDVLANDNSEADGSIRIQNVSSAASGFVALNDNGTPTNFSDDFIAYRPNAGFAGVDQFTYTIVSGSGIQSTAEVTVTVGNPSADDLVNIDFRLLDANGAPVTEVTVGDTFQLQVIVDDLRPEAAGAARGVFAAYMDVLYDAGLVRVANTTGNRLGFDVQFGANYDPDTAVGDALVPGLINEFGTFQESNSPLGASPVELATITFVATAAGNLRLVADPADVSPFQDTLLFDPPNAVPISQIRYDVANLTIVSGSGGEGESLLQNQNNPHDVNADGSVSPIDALLVVNQLNRGGAGEGETAAAGTQKFYMDVNGDKNVSPIDALQVVNYLNRNGGSSLGGEGEATPPISVKQSSASSHAEASDSFFAELGQSSVGSSATGGSSNTVAASSATPLSGISDSGDDEESEKEDLLKLLAADSPLRTEL